MEDGVCEDCGEWHPDLKVLSCLNWHKRLCIGCLANNMAIFDATFNRMGPRRSARIEIKEEEE